MEDNNKSFDQEQEIDIRELIEKLLNRKWLIIGITFLFVLTAGILSFFVLPPVFEAQSTIMVTHGERRTQTVVRGDTESMVDNLYRLPEMTINTYIRQITTQEVLAATVEELGLQSLGYGAGSLRSMITATPIRDTNLIEIRVRNTNPRLAQDVANEVSRQTINFITENNRSQLVQSVVFLDEQLSQVRAEISQEREIVNLMDQQSRNVSFLSAQQESLTRELIDFKSQLNQTQVAYNQALQGKTSLESRIAGLTLDAPEYQEIRTQYARQTTQVAELEGRLSSLRSMIATMEAEFDRVQKEFSEKNQEYQAARNRLRSLEDAESVLAEKRLQTQITQSVDLGETSLRMISRATLPGSPVSPRKMMNIAIAGVLGLMGSVFLAFLLEFLDNTIKNSDDVAKHLGLPVLGAIPVYRDMKAKEEPFDEEII